MLNLIIAVLIGLLVVYLIRTYMPAEAGLKNILIIIVIILLVLYLLRFAGLL